MPGPNNARNKKKSKKKVKRVNANPEPRPPCPPSSLQATGTRFDEQQSQPPSPSSTIDSKPLPKLPRTPSAHLTKDQIHPLNRSPPLEPLPQPLPLEGSQVF